MVASACDAQQRRRRPAQCASRISARVPQIPVDCAERAQYINFIQNDSMKMPLSIQRPMHILGIESSCDDTGVAICDEDGIVLSNCLHSQQIVTNSMGGIVPAVAKELHVANIDVIANKAFRESKLQSVRGDINAIAVTNRPGLTLSLQVGLNYARSLALKYSKPLIPIHHMQAHALMPLLQHRTIKFPFLALLMSGGHCLLAIAKRFNDFHVLGGSRDLAPGDVLDKFARRLRLRNLGPPFDSISGGAAIELMAQREGSNKYKYDHVVPMTSVMSCEFSFGGHSDFLDTVAPEIDILWEGRNRENLLNELSHICASIQRLLLIQLVRKVQRALAYYRGVWRFHNEDAFCQSDTQVRHLGYKIRDLIDDNPGVIDLVISGGCAANKYLVNNLGRICASCFEPDMRTFAPSKDLCSDNGLMIAWNGALRLRHHNSIPKEFRQSDIDNGVLYGAEQMEKVQVFHKSLMGIDLTNNLRTCHLKLRQIKDVEVTGTGGL